MDAVAREGAGSVSPVAHWYAGRSVLVTGATGFVGKAIIEKLLRSCPDVTTIYMLVRPKGGKDPRERLDAFVSDVLFSKVRAERPDFERHLVVIAGDFNSPDFQLEEQDLAALRRDVSVVFHCAASVRFDLSLRAAVINNVVGTKHLLQLAEQMPNLQVFTYVSTSFCHSDHKVLEEKLYPAKADPEKIMDIVSWMDDDLLKDLTPKLLGKLPNTYALTKNLTEQLVANYSDRLPIIIARPSIVVSSWKEPFTGWAANMNGPIGFAVACGKGVMRAIITDLNIIFDTIPVDCTANAIIAVAWHFAETKKPSPYVCNVTAGHHMSSTWRTVVNHLLSLVQTEVPLRPVIWYPDPIFTTSVAWYTICNFFLEVLPAHILDFFILLAGRKPFLVHLGNRLEEAKTMMRYYMIHQWSFINKKLESLYEIMTPDDQETFYFKFEEPNLRSYLKDILIGVKMYLLKESVDNIPDDLRYIRRMYWLHNVARVIFYGLLVWFVYSWSQPAMATLETVMTYLVSVFYGSPVIREVAAGVPVPGTELPQHFDVKNG